MDMWGFRLRRFIALATVGAFAITACGKKTTPTTTPDALGNPPVGVVNNAAGFYVRAVLNSTVQYPVHKGLAVAVGAAVPSSASYDYSSTCTIQPGDTNKDVMCYVEGNELDLYFNGVTLQYNVPTTMCSYFEVRTPWYYKYPTGVGPNISLHTVDSTGGPPVVDTYNSIGGVPYCAYDYSNHGTSTYPNCCFGNYDAVLISKNAAPAGTTTTSSVVSWGGSYQGCLSGPATDLAATGTNGIPYYTIHYVNGTGVNAAVPIATPLSKQFSGNIYVANYFTSSDYNDPTTYPAAFAPANNVNVPSEYPPAAAGSGTLTPSPYVGQPFYEYRCYDQAQELNYRIRVMVRSWDAVGLAGVSTTPYGLGNGISQAPSNSESPPFGIFPLQDRTVWDLLFPPLTTYGTSPDGGYPEGNE
jgi:hypothetical protein